MSGLVSGRKRAGGLMCVALGGLLMVSASMVAFGVGLDEEPAPDREAEAVVTDLVRIRPGGGPIGSQSAPRVTYEVDGLRCTSRQPTSMKCRFGGTRIFSQNAHATGWKP